MTARKTRPTTTTEETIVADKPGTALATFDAADSAFPVLFQQDGEGSLAQIIDDNFGEEGFDPTALDRLTVPAGGQSTYWTVPDEDPQKYVEGVLVHKQATRSFWFKKRGEDGEDDGPPDCASDDSVVGNGTFGPGSTGNPTGLCAECPMSQWGSGQGNGKACKEQMQLFVLQPESVLPVQVTLPPTSLRGWKQYMTRLASKGKSYNAVVTKLGLKIEKGNGQTYAVVVPERGGILEPEEAQAARQYGSVIRAYFEQAMEQRKLARAAAENLQGLPDTEPPAE